MRYQFVPKDSWEPGCGMLVNDETGDLVNFGAFYLVACERDDTSSLLTASEARVAALQTQYEAMRERLEAAEDIVDRSLAHFPEKKLRALAHGYRTQYPRVGEERNK